MALIRRSRFDNGAFLTVSGSDFWNFGLKGLSERLVVVGGPERFGAASLGLLEVGRSGASGLAAGACFRLLGLLLCWFFGAIGVWVCSSS